jgi:hypothetical protein
LTDDDWFPTERLGQAQQAPFDLVPDQSLLAAADVELDRTVKPLEARPLEDRANSAGQALAEAHGDPPAMRP